MSGLLPRFRLRRLAGWGVGLCLPAMALALLPLPYTLLALIAITLLLLSLIDPIWALYAAILTVPLQRLIELPGGLTPTQLALLIAIVGSGAYALSHPEQPLRVGRPGMALMVLLWVLLLSASFSRFSLLEGLKESYRWAVALLAFLIAYNRLSVDEVRRPWRSIGLLACLIGATAINAGYGLWQFFTASGPDSFLIAGGRFVRAYGSIGQPNSFAGSLNIVWPLAAAFLLSAALFRLERPDVFCLGAAGWSGLAGAALGLSLILAALLASFSRGGWLGALAGVLALLLAGASILNRQRRRWFRRALLAGGVVLVLLLGMGGSGLLPAPLAARIAGIAGNLRLFDVRTVQVDPANFAVVERMAHLQAGWRMLRANPLLGVGTGNYNLAYEGGGAADRAYALHPWYDSRGHAHNYYLHIAAESGLLGLGAYLGLLGLLAYQSLLLLRKAQDWLWYALGAGSCGMIVAVAAHNLFEHLHVLNLGIHLAAVWGMLCAAEVVLNNRPVEPER
jgi:O-antigen ligase